MIHRFEKRMLIRSGRKSNHNSWLRIGTRARLLSAELVLRVEFPCTLGSWGMEMELEMEKGASTSLKIAHIKNKKINRSQLHKVTNNQ